MPLRDAGIEYAAPTMAIGLSTTKNTTSGTPRQAADPDETPRALTLQRPREKYPEMKNKRPIN